MGILPLKYVNDVRKKWKRNLITMNTKRIKLKQRSMDFLHEVLLKSKENGEYAKYKDAQAFDLGRWYEINFPYIPRSLTQKSGGEKKL